MNVINGVVIGTVKDLNDPQGEGRIKVEYRWMPGQVESFWAPVATFMSGKERGSWFMPEREDEVLVAFDHGSADHPYVIGFLWNGKDKPPQTDPNVRMLKTVKGHTVTLDDTDKKERVEIRTMSGHTFLLSDEDGQERVETRTNGGHSILLNDKQGEEKIEVRSNNGHYILIEDTNPGKIQIASTNGTKVVIEDNQSIELTAGSTTLKMKVQENTIELSGGQRQLKMSSGKVEFT